MPRIPLTDFTLQRVTFEARYENAYALWDRAGQIWTEARQNWPQVTLDTAEPGITTFHLRRDYEFATKLDRMHVIANIYSVKNDEFISVSGAFLSIIQHHLSLVEYTRLGMRMIYFLEMAEESEAAKRLIGTGLIKAPEGTQFNIQGQPLSPEYAIRWEDESLGLHARISAITRRTDLNPPFSVPEIEPATYEKSGIQYDIDYYTKQTTTVSQLRVRDWIENAQRIIRRDSSVFLGE